MPRFLRVPRCRVFALSRAEGLGNSRRWLGKMQFRVWGLGFRVWGLGFRV